MSYLNILIWNKLKMPGQQLTTKSTMWHKCNFNAVILMLSFNAVILLKIWHLLQQENIIKVIRKAILERHLEERVVMYQEKL